MCIIIPYVKRSNPPNNHTKHKHRLKHPTQQHKQPFISTYTPARNINSKAKPILITSTHTLKHELLPSDTTFHPNLSYQRETPNIISQIPLEPKS